MRLFILDLAKTIVYIILCYIFLLAIFFVVSKPTIHSDGSLWFHIRPWLFFDNVNFFKKDANLKKNRLIFIKNMNYIPDGIFEKQSLDDLPLDESETMRKKNTNALNLKYKKIYSKLLNDFEEINDDYFSSPNKLSFEEEEVFYNKYDNLEVSIDEYINEIEK